MCICQPTRAAVAGSSAHPRASCCGPRRSCSFRGALIIILPLIATDHFCSPLFLSFLLSTPSFFFLDDYRA